MNSNESENLQIILSQSIGFLLSRSHRILQRQIAKALQPLKLTLKEYVVLRLLSMKVKISQGALGETYDIDPATMVAITERLERDGLISRSRNDHDRRSYVIRLTPRGSKVLKRAQKIVWAEQENFLSPLNGEQAAQLKELLFVLLKSSKTSFQ